MSSIGVPNPHSMHPAGCQTTDPMAERRWTGKDGVQYRKVISTGKTYKLVNDTWEEVSR